MLVYKALEEFIAPFGTIVWSSWPWNFLGREHLTIGVLRVFAGPKLIRNMSKLVSWLKKGF